MTRDKTYAVHTETFKNCNGNSFHICSRREGSVIFLVIFVFQLPAGTSDAASKTAVKEAVQAPTLFIRYGSVIAVTEPAAKPAVTSKFYLDTDLLLLFDTKNISMKTSIKLHLNISFSDNLTCQINLTYNVMCLTLNALDISED